MIVFSYVAKVVLISCVIASVAFYAVGIFLFFNDRKVVKKYKEWIKAR